MLTTPLADLVRPKNFDQVAGQSHLLSATAPLRRMIERGHIPSLVFYGPPGTGKTTVANIIAGMSNKMFYKLNATGASLSDIKEILSRTDTLMTADGILLYIDEIQYFNKKQQQSLLEYMEDGRVTLISSTTENPYFSIYGALLSRSGVFEFKPVNPEEIIPVLKHAFEVLDTQAGEGKEISEEVYTTIAYSCGGDVRKALNALENIYYASDKELTDNNARELTQRSGMRYDRDGNQHYNLLSAFQKSIRGSDENAAVFYLARILEGGDLLSVCRRLLVIAAEDVGLAYPMAIVITKACVDSALQIGLPEAKLPLAQATIMLATSPKSNTAMKAYFAAEQVIKSGGGMSVPDHISDSHTGATAGRKYKYPHDYKDSYVPQQYLPDDIKDKVFYTPGDNKTERAAREYQKKIKGK